MGNKRDKQEFVITRKELRQLLFWASIGVCKSSGGSYGHTIEGTICEWSTTLGLNIPYHVKYPEFHGVKGRRG